MAQVALSIVLLLGAGLLMRTFVKLVGVDLGFDPKNVLVAAVAFPRVRMPRQRISAVSIARPSIGLARSPAYESAAISNGPPPFGGMSSGLEIPGIAVAPQILERLCSSAANASSRRSAFLSSGGVLCQGSTWRDSHHVALVNETLAKKYFGSDEPLGRTIRLPRLATFPSPLRIRRSKSSVSCATSRTRAPASLLRPGAPPVHIARPGWVRVRGAYIRRSDARGQRRPSGDASGRTGRSRWLSPPQWRT